MSSHRNVNKSVIVKKFSDFPHHIQDIWKSDVESNNRGILTLFSDGKLILTTWVNKKISSKLLEDVSDAQWQRGGESEVIIMCNNGMLQRYSLHFDTGLSCSLQLSAPSLLAMIREKDSSIRSLRSSKVFGYNVDHILLQLKNDRLAVLATNGGGRPAVVGVLRTPPLRTAHLSQGVILVQPLTGNDLYEYSIQTCKVLEVVNLGLQRTQPTLIEWGSLVCSATGETVSLVDSERHLYVTHFGKRTLGNNKGGICRSKVALRQVVWPSNFQPTKISQISLALSDMMLSVFCRIVDEGAEVHHYLAFDVNSKCLNSHHIFTEYTVLVPGLFHQLPDLFITAEGIAMLMDEDVSVSSVDSEVDLEEMLTALDDSLKEQNISKITEVKAAVEQGLSVFLSSCNHQEGWVSLAESRAQQYGRLASLLLSYITDFAQSPDSYSLALAIKNMAEHHFMNIHEEMANVLLYVDNESTSQMVLQMKEQVSFYLRSVEQLQLPEEGGDNKGLSEQYLLWGDKPLKQILEDALDKKCVNAAECYLQLKPWVYGTVTTDEIISTCIGIAREKSSSGSGNNILINVDENYQEKLKQILYNTDDLFVLDVLGDAMKQQQCLNHLEIMALDLVCAIHRIHSDLLTLPPRIWTELVHHGDASAEDVVGPITVGQVARWTPLAMMLVMTDLYVCTADPGVLVSVDADVMWQYLLYQHDLKNIKRWILKEFCITDESVLIEKDGLWQYSEKVWTDPVFRLASNKAGESWTEPGKSQKAVDSEGEGSSQSKGIGVDILMGPQYGSDSESSPNSQDKISVHSISMSVCDVDSWSIQSFDITDRTDITWADDLFRPITQAMVDLVVISEGPFAELVLNILATLGVFTTSERKSSHCLMKRLLISGAFEKIGSLNGSHDCQMTEGDIHNVILEYFGKSNLFTVAFDYVKKFSLQEELDLKKDTFKLPSWTRLISSFMKLEDQKSKAIIYDLSLKNLSLLCESNQNAKDLEFPVFLTMLFAPTRSLVDFLDFKEGNDGESQEIAPVYNILSKVSCTPKQVVENLASKYPYLKKILSESESTTTADVTMYDLLNDNIPYDISRLFIWQPENRHGYDSSATMPTFSDRELMKKYGLFHSLDFMYYLRDARPSYACAALITSLGINENNMEHVKNKVYGLALSCWPDKAVCAACVSLLYMSNLDAEPLRVVLASAYHVLQSRSEKWSKMKLEKRQAQEHLAVTEIRDVLEQLCIMDSRNHAAALLMGMLEDGIVSTAKAELKDKQETGGKEVGERSAYSQVMSQDHMLIYIEGMRLCVELSRVYNLPWPAKILVDLAKSNQWLLFLVLAQVFKCPRTESRKIAELFQSMALKEHMMFALSHIHYYRDVTTQNQGSRTPNRNLRSALYSRIGIKSRSDSVSPTPSNGDEKQRSNSPSEFDLSTIDDVLSVTTNETCLDVGLDAWRSYEFKDLYSILLCCHQKENPAVELATAAVALEAPVLTVLAACYCEESSLTYLAIWMYTQLKQESKKKLHSIMIKDEIFHNLVINNGKVDKGVQKNSSCCRSCDNYVLQSGLIEVKNFLLLHISEGALDVPIEGLRIFFPSSPLLPLLLALVEVKTRGRQETVTRLLSQCSLTLTEASEGKLDPLSMDKDWFASCVVSIIGTALDDYITNSHMQYQLFNELQTVSQQHPFCDCNVNWSLTGELCKAFKTVRCQISFKDLLISFEIGEMKAELEKIVSMLNCRKKFKEALSVSQLVSLPTYEILCAQILAEFERECSIFLENKSAFEDFLKESHNQLCEEGVPLHHAVQCFVSMSKHIERYDIRYLCLQYAVIWTNRIQGGSASSSAVTTPVLPEISEGDSENLQYEMWSHFVKAHQETLELPVYPIKHLGHWPWEGADGKSPLNRSIIVKSAGLKFDGSFVIRSISEEDEKQDGSSPQLPCSLSHLPHTSADSSHLPLQSPQNSDGDDSELMCGMSYPSSHQNINMELVDKEELGTSKEIEYDEDFNKAITKVVGKCLDSGIIITACRILRFFKKSNKDVDTILQMLSLADGSESDKLNETSSCSGESFKLVSSQSTGRKKRTSSRNISISSLSVLSLDPDDDIGLKTPSLVRKSAGLRHGKKIAERIILLYRVAAALDLSYIYVIHHPNAVTLLSLVLHLKGGGVIQLARDLIMALPIPENVVVNYLCEEAVATITAGPGAPGTVQSERLLLWEELETQWRDLITLCNDPSSLGNQLLDVGQRIGSSYPDQVEKVHSMSVELVIRAHDCFTAASNMEGISTVLRTSFYLTTSLLQHSQWSLMVRLLIGVGRYGEMSYIIDALREHDQFEPLLGRGSESKGSGTGLDRALVHYLRSKYPNDTDTLILVALHFLLYSEVAAMWAGDADKAVDQVLEATVDIGISCSSTVNSPPSKSYSKDTPSKSASRKYSSADRQLSLTEEVTPVYLNNADSNLLTQAMHSYAHAAQYYMRDQQLTAAVTCSRSAELVALQIAHVRHSSNDTALRLLKLSSAGIRCITMKHLNVREAILVGRAYDASVDWSAALYHQFIVDGNEAYLTEFLENFPLTSEILLNVVKKLEHGGLTKARQERIAKLLAYIDEADVVYRVASQLGLKNNIEACLGSHSAPYLKDTVFKKGFTST